MQAKYMEFQMIQQSMQQLQQRKQIIENQMTEFTTLIETLDGLKGAKKASPIFAPLGSGVFAKATLEENDNVLVNIGSGIAIERDIATSKELVKKQLVELQDLAKQLDAEVKEGIEKGTKLSAELSKAAATQQQEHVHDENCAHDHKH